MEFLDENQRPIGDAPRVPPTKAQLKNAPRVTQQEVDWTIESAHYFTGAQAIAGAAMAQGRSVGDMNESLALLTICVLVLRNGFTVVGKSACVSPLQFDAEDGKKLAREDAMRQVWPLLGYALRDRIFHYPKVLPTIAQLEVVLDTLDTNEPDIKQANLEAQNAEAHRLAIALLTP